MIRELKVNRQSQTLNDNYLKFETHASNITRFFTTKLTLAAVLFGLTSVGYPALSTAAPTLHSLDSTEQSTSFDSAIPQQMSRAQFIEVFGDVYEHSAWVAERCYDESSVGELDNKAAVFRCLSTVVEHADASAKLALIKSHPQLGLANSTAVKLTAASAKEQLGSGLSDLPPHVLREIIKLNASYQEKFGFPFVMAVSGKRPEEIMAGLRGRLSHARAQELEIAISEVNKIALIRILNL